MPEEIQRKRIKGYRMPPNTVSVARPGTWGNPHVVGEGCGDAATACNRYAHDLITMRLADRAGVPLLNRLGELRGKNLACFCPIGQPCHRQVLLYHKKVPQSSTKTHGRYYCKNLWRRVNIRELLHKLYRGAQ